VTKRGLQVICRCNAYRFPHRLGGGRCSGLLWADSYNKHERDLCGSCNSNVNGICEVAEGIESIRECEGFQEHLRMQLPARHPTSESELFRTLEEQAHARYFREECPPDPS